MAEQHGLKRYIKRYFTKGLEDQKDKTVYDLFQWEKRDVVLKDYKTGDTLTDLRDLEFPVHYSQQAADIIASKYFRKAGVPETGHEVSMRQVAHRMVAFWIASLEDEKLIDNADEAQILYDELVYGLLAQLFAPNSPQWFNTGLKHAYGIAGGQSHNYYYDPEKGETVMSEDDYTRSQASACFILSIEDKLLGAHSISEEYVTETKLFKGGSGTGTNFSNIRGEGEKLSGGGVSSGLMSFLKGLDRNAGAIKSGGTTRRAAKMVSLDVDHPEIENFVKWKAEEEDKALALMKMGYDGDIDGEAYSTVSGQNSNNSLRITDDFMQKVANLDNEPDSTIELKGRVDESVNREISVGYLWDLINESAWRCADPAPQFSDIFNAWHTSPAGEDGQTWARHNRLNSTNPCGEYAFLDDTSCNLASINVFRFFNEEDQTFDIEGYLHVITLAQLVLEASINWGHFPTPDIARRTYLFRTTGLGIANLASLLMVYGLPYDSNEARQLSAALAGILTGRSYHISALMAEKVGPFEKYKLNAKHMNRVIRNHARVAGARKDKLEELNYEPLMVNHEQLKMIGAEGISQSLVKEWNEAVKQGDKHGYRNAQVTVMAPTGTISFAMDCGATSIEPFFSHVSFKKLVGGGFMTLTNPVIPVALAQLGYVEEEIKDIVAYVEREENGALIDGKIEGAPHLKTEHYAIFDTANKSGSGERYIRPEGHVLMVAAMSPLVTGAISKTVNLPNEATVQDFKDVVMLSWRTGVKGITLYRDGSKNAQPLNVSMNKLTDEQDLGELNYADLLAYANKMKDEAEKQEDKPSSRRKRPAGIRSGRTHPAQIDDVKIYTTVNRNGDDKISEIYITTDREGTTIMGLLNSLSKTISVMLQYNIPAWNISKMLRGQKYEPYGFVQRHPNIKYASSISDLVSKIIDIELGDYSRVQVKPDGETQSIADLDRSLHSTDPNVTDMLKSETASTDKPTGAAVATLDEDELDSDDPYTQAFIHESAREAAIHGSRVYDGSNCPTCSSTRMVQNGTCKVCLECGTTTGCS